MAFTILILTFSSYSTQKAFAAELLTNGGFETGNFTGWTATNPSSGWRLWAVTGSGFGGNDGGAFVPVPNATSVQQGTFNAWHGVTAGTNQSFTLTQDVALPAGMNIRLTWMDRYQMNYTQFCGSGSNPACGTATYAVEILNTSNTLLQTLYTVTTLNNSNSNTGWVNHVASLTAFRGTTIRLRFRTTVTLDLRGPGQLEIDAVSAQSLTPTSANASVGGRVLTFDDRPISRARVTLTDASGNIRAALTNSFGYYVFDEVPVGATYLLDANSKQYSFSDSPRVLSVEDNLSNEDFHANP